MDTSTVAIMNPKAGGGNTRVKIPRSVEVLQTEGPGHATELTRAAIRRGAESIIALGGDGTINEVVNGFFQDDERLGAGVTLSIIPRGTGSDFYRLLKQQHSGEKRVIDLMKVRYTANDNSTATRYAINVTSFGLG